MIQVKKSINNIKSDNCHLTELKERKTLEQFSARGMAPHGWKDIPTFLHSTFLNGGIKKVAGAGFSRPALIKCIFWNKVWTCCHFRQNSSKSRFWLSPSWTCCHFRQNSSKSRFRLSPSWTCCHFCQNLSKSRFWLSPSWTCCHFRQNSSKSRFWLSPPWTCCHFRQLSSELRFWLSLSWTCCHFRQNSSKSRFRLSLSLTCCYDTMILWHYDTMILWHGYHIFLYWVSKNMVSND